MSGTLAGGSAFDEKRLGPRIGGAPHDRIDQVTVGMMLRRFLKAANGAKSATNHTTSAGKGVQCSTCHRNVSAEEQFELPLPAGNR